MKTTANVFKKQFLKTCTQFEKVYAELEEQEYYKLKQICARLQKTDHVNQAIQICLTCTAQYCIPKPDQTGEITNV